MKRTSLLRRSALATALGAVLAGAFSLSSSASAATTYWSFDNAVRGCLTAGTSGVVFETACSAQNAFQDWQWIGSADDHLQNLATGLCLTTDDKSDVNAVWQGDCNASEHGQSWSFTYLGDGSRLGVLQTYWGTWLRATDTPNAVYTDAGIAGNPNYYNWSVGLQ
ncbi:hypothetical protein [Streptomyces hoynatensis]|uniref:Uncharacterized protein n=1 Tax=Streptomyces hoynatensis TaxID=1141874 RepID=A0A3A9YZ73_9ACTN|nr:hypothetical protein [Streptomyces hoynatensis]RKN41170.1 hypothetical protein D7294_15685 [Streptomyces hoynatensis]